MKEKRMPKRHGPSWETILIILGAVVLWFGFGMLLNTDGGGSGEYSSYSGPVLPLAAVSGGENLEVQRMWILILRLTKTMCPPSSAKERALSRILIA